MMTSHDPEIEQLRATVNCAALLERLPPPWRFDRRQSTPHCLKYRREKGEILIVSHQGRGWWDPRSDAKGDVFDLVQHLSPSLNFGQARKVLREFAGIGPSFPEAIRARHEKASPDIPIAEKWAKRRRLKRGSPVWKYLSEVRHLPASVLQAGRAADILREGPYGSAWFAHCDASHRVTHVEIRGPDYRGALKDGAKILFRLSLATGTPARFVLAEAPIDALSLAAIEGMRAGTLYAATGGGMGPATIEAIARILAEMAGTPGAIFCSAADANPAGERYALRHQELAACAGVPFERLAPPIEQGDWNEVLKHQARQRTAS